MQAVALKNIQAWIGLSLMEGPGPWENAPRYNPNPVTSRAIAAISTFRDPSPGYGHRLERASGGEYV